MQDEDVQAVINLWNETFGWCITERQAKVWLRAYSIGIITDAIAVLATKPKITDRVRYVSGIMRNMRELREEQPDCTLCDDPTPAVFWVTTESGDSGLFCLKHFVVVCRGTPETGNPDRVLAEVRVLK